MSYTPPPPKRKPILESNPPGRCPKCHAWSIPATLMSRGNEEIFTDWDTGQEGVRWSETHLCICGTVYRCDNANL